MGNVILCREKFKQVRVGCCGASRQDMIYPIGSYTSEKEFIKDAYSMVESFGIGTFDRVPDTYSLEYFYGQPGQNFADPNNDISIYRLELEGEVWSYYKSGEKQFSAKDIKELEQKWEEFLK